MHGRLFLHPGGGRGWGGGDGGFHLLPPSLLHWPHLSCPRGQVGPAIFHKVVQLRGKLVAEEEGLGGEGCFVGCHPDASGDDPGDQGAGP